MFISMLVWMLFQGHQWQDVLEIIKVFLELGIAVVGVAVSVVAFIISMDANIAAQKSLEITTFTHKKNVEPELTLQWSPASQGTEMTLVLKNVSSGNAKIIAIRPSFKNPLEYIKPYKLPFALLHNGWAGFSVLTGLKELGTSDEGALRDAIKETLVNSFVVVFYKDILGTPYRIKFDHNPIGNLFTPTVEEIDPEDKGWKPFFEVKK